MASVKATFTFSCPKCDKVLRTSSRPAEDKKIKCPACGKPFVPELDDEDDDEGTRIQEKPTLKAKPKVKANASKASGKKRRVDDDDDDEDERPALKKKPAKKSGGNMFLIILLVLAGGGVFLGLGVCGVGAFVWPGFLVAKTDGKIAQDDQKKADADSSKDGAPAADAAKNKDAAKDGAKDKDAKDGTKDGVKPKDQVPVIDAVTLAQEFRTNGKEAGQKYKGTLLEVSGKVTFVSEKGAVVILDGGDKPVAGKTLKNVQFTFDKAATEQIAKLQKGQTVTIRGRFFQNLTNVHLKEAEVRDVQLVDDPGNNPKGKDDVIVVDAPSLVREFRANSNAARQKYQGKRLEISAKILLVLEAVNSVVLDGGEKFDGKKKLMDVQFIFDEAYLAELEKLKEGQTATLRGRFFDDKINVVLMDAEIVGVPIVKGGGKKPSLPPQGNPFNNNNIYDFVYPQSNYLLGANTRDLRFRSQLDGVIKEVEGFLPPGSPPIFVDIARSSDSILVSVDSSNKQTLIIGFTFSSPQAMQGVKAKLKLGGEEILADRYRIHRQDGKDLAPIVAFPGDRLMLLCGLTDEELLGVLRDADDKQVKPCPALALSNAVKNDPLWVAVAFSDKDRKELEESTASLKLPQAKPILDTVTRAKGVSVALSPFPAGNYQIRVNVACADADDAKQVVSSILDLRSFFQKEWVPVVQASIGVQTLINTIALQNNGETATASVFFSKQTILEFANLLTNPKKGAPGKDFPPPKDFAGKDQPAKESMPKSGTLLAQFPLQNIVPNASQEKVGKLPLPQGLNVVLQAQSTVAPKTPKGGKGLPPPVPQPAQVDVKVEVVRGQGGKGEVIAQGVDRGQGVRLEFVVPAMDIYRIRITNNGTTNVTQTVVGMAVK